VNILQVIPYFPPAYAFGGSVRVCYATSKELVRRGHSVTVYTSDALDSTSRMKVENQNVDGIDVHYFRNISLSLVRSSNLFIVRGLLREAASDVSSFDVIHLHEYTTYHNIVVHRFAKKHRVPYVFQAHGTLPKIGRVTRKRLFDILFGHRLLQDMAKGVALNRWEANHYMEAGVNGDKIAIIPSGIDLSEYAKLPSKGSFRRKVGINSEDKIVLYLGRIHWIKGVDVLVKAFAEVARKLDNVKLALVGPDDGYLNELQAMISALKIDDKVLIVGPLYLSDKIEAYVDADVYVLPSRFEAFPIGMLEAYACGKPVITSAVGGMKDLVVDGVTGLLIGPEDSEQLAEAMLSLLNDHERAEELGESASGFVSKNFRIEESAIKLEQLYYEVEGLGK
jgi:glycosyltransferase involved in cell wall biosynthesis